MSGAPRIIWPKDEHASVRDWLQALAIKAGDPRVTPPKPAEPKPPPAAGGNDFSQLPPQGRPR
jgi:hypothetical protein